MNIAKIRVQPTVKGGFSISIERITGQIKKIGKELRSLFETTGHRFGRSCVHVLPGDKICEPETTRIARIARFCCATRPRRCINTIAAEVDMRRTQCDWWDRLFQLIWEQRDQEQLNTQLANVVDI
jgi:hypothetical protein